MPTDIRVTSRQLFKRCRRQFEFNCLMKLRPVGARGVSLAMGTAFHRAPAEYYRFLLGGGSHAAALNVGITAAMTEWDRQLKPWNADSTFDLVGLKDAEELLASMVQTYLEWSHENDSWDTVLGIEQTFTHPITDDINLTGTVDMLVEQDGRLWIVDHKTCRGFRDADTLLLDDQMTAYIWLVQQTLKRPVTGAIYSQVRKKIPSVPTVIKDGSRLSYQMTDTTKEVYLREIERYGFDPEDYAEVLAKLKNNEFVRRDCIVQPKHRLQSFESYLLEETHDMTRPGMTYYPTPTYDCARYCDYYILCTIAMQEGDMSFAMDNLFFEESEQS